MASEKVKEKTTEKAEEKVKYRLQGHEKFVLREGWLNKGLLVVDYQPTVFLDKNAPDIFGIGNNMVKSLRYWLKAFGLIEANGNAGAKLTDTAKIIKQHDLYFEDVFTLWVLHSHLVKNKEDATTWFLFFNRCDIEDLDRAQINAVVGRELIKHLNSSGFPEKSLGSDIDVLLSMYGKAKEMTDPEDKNISPFSQLELIKTADNTYSKVIPDRRIINEWNVLYELAFWLQDTNSVSIEKISYGENSISAIYQINSVVINEYLDRLDALGYIRVDRTAGLDMIYKKDVSFFTPEQVMSEYYKHK